MTLSSAINIGDVISVSLPDRISSEGIFVRILEIHDDNRVTYQVEDENEEPLIFRNVKLVVQNIKGC